MSTAALEQALGVSLDPELLDLALTHRSWAYEHGGVATNERLEFLGDAILGQAVTVMLYTSYPELSEGDLAKRRASLVSAVALAEVARAIGLGEHLKLGKGEELSGGRMKPSILADAMEALIGAVYLASGFDGARDLVLRILETRLLTAPEDGADHKSRLQELVAHRFGSAPRYAVEATGPDHARTFFVTVLVDDVAYGRGEGRSKKQAEQAAARHACAALADIPPDTAPTLRETTHG